MASFRHDPNGDEIIQEIASVPRAPDVKEGRRTSLNSAPDERNLSEGDLRTAGNALDAHNRTPKRREKVVTLMHEIRDAEAPLRHRQEVMRVAQSNAYAFEYHAGKHHHPGRWRVPLERMLLALMALGETALAYIGFQFAVPSLGQARGDWLIELVAKYGSLLAALAVGCASACAQFVLGRELARANRGVLIDPPDSTDWRPTR